MGHRPEIAEVNDERAGYRRFTVATCGRRFSVLHTPENGPYQPAQTLVSIKDHDPLWSASNHLALDGHVSALACCDFISRAFCMAEMAREAGREQQAADRIAALEEKLRDAEATARRYARCYPEASDGRNTFTMLADHIATLQSIGDENE